VEPIILPVSWVATDKGPLNGCCCHSNLKLGNYTGESNKHLGMVNKSNRPEVERWPTNLIN